MPEIIKLYSNSNIDYLFANCFFASSHANCDSFSYIFYKSDRKFTGECLLFLALLARDYSRYYEKYRGSPKVGYFFSTSEEFNNSRRI